MPTLMHVTTPVIHVAMVIAATESPATNVAATAKQSVPVICVVTVSAAMESLVTNVAATAKPSVNVNFRLIKS